MQIYTGTCKGSKSELEAIASHGLGMCVSSECEKSYKGFPIFIDNGAYEAFRRGMPWSEARFYKLLDRCWDCGIICDFIVCPDIMCAGLKSLEHSMKWVSKLQPAKIALAVQDGMQPNNVDQYGTEGFSHIFIGGSVEWKWANAKMWVDYAHGKGLKCHIGKCGKLEYLKYAEKIGADSVDSTTWVRNDNWTIVEQFNNKSQTNLLDLNQKSKP